jgi:hypothetical protein
MSDATWTPRTAREWEAVESVAKVVHAAMREVQPPNATQAWVDGGNAIAQDVARYAAKNILAMFEKPVPAPPTRLREYKGVVFRDGLFYYRSGDSGTVDALTACRYWIGVCATDVDHAALMDLKANPTEPSPDAVVEAIRDFWQSTRDANALATTNAAETLAATVRAIVRAEVEGEGTPTFADTLAAQSFRQHLASKLTVAEHAADGDRLALRQLRLELGERLVDRPEDSRQQIGRDGGDDAEPELAAERILIGLRDVHHLVDLAQHPLRLRDDPLPDRGQHHLPIAALDQHDT